MQKTVVHYGRNARFRRGNCEGGDPCGRQGRGHGPQPRRHRPGRAPDGDQLLSIELDVTNADQARRAVDAAVKRFGGIDVLVNNAGYGHLGFFEENTPQDVQTQFNTNVFGVFNVT